MLEAFISTPKQFKWYKEAFNFFDTNSSARWYWNSGAFLGGFWYFLYRKDLKTALSLLFLELILATILPLNIFIFIFIFISILIGGLGTLMIYQKYQRDKSGIEKMFKEEDKRIGVIKIIAGVNSTAYWAGILSMVSLILIVIGLFIVAK
jgi:hypothetical protein